MEAPGKQDQISVWAMKAREGHTKQRGPGKMFPTEGTAYAQRLTGMSVPHGLRNLLVLPGGWNTEAGK